MKTIGIDPGAVYTAVVVRDFVTDAILLASTFVKPKDMPIFAWSIQVGEYITDEVIALYPDAQIGIEGIADPKGYKNGKKSPLNPKYIIQAGIVAGALSQRFPQAVIVPPGHNGTSRVPYPEVLNGRRPVDLPGRSKGAGTRNHEKSAYDIAGEVLLLKKEGYVLDLKSEI